MKLNKIKKIILEMGLTQSEIARRHCTGVGNISMFLNGHSRSKRVALILSKELKLDIHKILKMHEAKK